jgi:hypothetical protein
VLKSSAGAFAPVRVGALLHCSSWILRLRSLLSSQETRGHHTVCLRMSKIAFLGASGVSDLRLLLLCAQTQTMTDC